ncbi:LOW QUALITY PROTEIN: tyrosine-protein kinase Srms-like [Morone saxatilis]|uniref:LOW QUALITY PROTEIN: tyrosine-protein kinase Srms-like n=1 Tax=Morone saxatilis TaxID=34816 RepID=UPI0015E1C4E0|nr:LOW QUALITY PROTEIN: tyrosine-protein kinase Srms-like [Morone saxatilis]
MTWLWLGTFAGVRGRCYHFRIQRSTIGAYFVSDKLSFGTLGELISLLQKNPRSLAVLLEEPCAQQRELFDMEPWERPREEFRLHKKLGEGHFGEVWEALWTTENRKVAIKTLKQEDTKQDEFVKEVQALKSLHHPKLIQLLAMCSRGEPVYIVTELMSKGSLKSYLASAEGQVLTSAHLIYMGSQIAEGMAYLEDRNIVHRDLAARNILVGDDLVCKVADFGLARIIKDSVYTASRSTKIPVRWTAPEAAIYQRFSVKSDVWSFGVLLYEMMSRGKMPYEGKSNKEVLDLLSSGFRLPCPTRCPQNIYRIMMDCWAAEPSKRPSFHALHSQLDTIYARIYFKTIEV